MNNMSSTSTFCRSTEWTDRVNGYERQNAEDLEIKLALGNPATTIKCQDYSRENLAT